MANYIMRSNGTTYEEVKKKKKKTTTSNNTSTGNNYIMRNDGTTYLEQPTVSSQQSGQLAPVKSKKVATTVAPTRANVSTATEKKYAGYTMEQLVKEKGKITQKMNKAAAGGKDENLLEAFINSVSGKNKNNLNSKEYKVYKKQYEELNNYMANKSAKEHKVDTMDKIAEPFEYGVEKANEAINTTVQKARNSAPDWMKAEKHKITAKEPTVGDMIHEKVNDSYKTKLGKTYSDLSYTIGYMTPSMMMPGAGGSLAMTGVTSFGGSYQDAINQGKTDKQATKYGLINATLEVGLEKALGGFSSIYGKSATSKLTGKLMSKLIGNKAVRDILGRAGSEFTEEYLQEFLDPIVRNVVLDEKNGADFWNEKNIGKAVKALSKQFFNKENLYAGTLGAISAGVLETPDVYRKSKFSKETGRDYNTGYTENEQTVIDKTIEKRLEEKENSEQRTEKERKKIEKEVKEDLEAGKIPFNEVVEALGENRITPQDTYLVESYNDEQNKAKRYEYKGNIDELSEYGRAAVESAKIVANNTKSSQDFVNAMVKMSEDRQMAYKFTTTEELQKNGLVPEGKQANSLYVTNNNGNREVLVNINSSKYLESLLVHETTHDLESNKELYNALKDATENFAVAKGDYNKIRKEVMETYTDKDGHLMSNVDINSEVTARLLEDYLGNEEYISHLTNQKPNLVQKIIDTVKYLKKQFTAGSKEARRLNNLQYKMEQAYKKAYNNQSKLAPVKGNIKYSLIGEVGLKNLSKENNKAYISLNNRLKKAKSMNEKKVSNQEIWLETGWFLDKNNRWKYDLTDKPFSLKEVNIKENTSYKLGDLVEHKALFKLYPELKDITVRIKDYNNESTNGSYSKNSNEINISNKLLNIQDIEGTLIHEIQHAIQKIEGFEGGSNTRLSRLKYYNSLGEIEASDTKERFINEKYNNYNLDNIPPSSVDKNAKHKDLNNYLQNRRTFDKIKDKIFVKDGDGSVQKNQEMDSEKYNRQNRTLVDARIEGTSDSSFSNAKYSLTDNQGNKLSKEQQEYFKDSKVRDENGNLQVVYHGTTEEINVFEKNRLGSNTGAASAEQGFFFTSSKEVADAYSMYARPTYIKELEAKQEELKKIAEKERTNEAWNNYYRAYEEYEEAELDYGYGGRKDYENTKETYLNITNPLIHDFKGEEYRDESYYDLLKQAKENGNDGAIFLNTYDGYGDHDSWNNPKTNIYVVFESNQIKNIDNTSPTSDADIRYSLSEDNNGRKLSKQQQEYFKDSKARDDNGKLKRYYNGGGDYTAFDNTKMSDQSKWGKGIYLTELKDIAKMYGDDVKEVYANVTTPINQEEKTISFEKYNNFMKTVYGEEAYREEYDMYDNDLDLLWDATNKGNWADYGKELKDILGIDGLIINDKSPSENMVVAFNSNQIKRIDNTNPTINDDIDYSLSNNKEELPYDRNKTRGEDVRYSEQIKQTIEPLRQEIQQLTQTINEIKTQPQQGNTIAEEKTNNDEVLTIRPDRKQYSINKRVQKAIENSSYKGIKEATAEADKYIKFTTQERRTFKDALSKYAGMTKEDFTNVNNYREIEAIVENFANREYNYVDTELKSMKDQVRNTKIKITDDLKNRITDYNDFRKSNFGKLKLGNEGQYIDDVWAELSETHPEYFSENITNEEDMLYALSDFMNEDINLTEQFRLSDEDIETVRDRVFNTLAHNQLRESDINELQTELDKVVERKKRTVVQENLLHEMNITREDIQKGNDISALAYQRTDPKRVHEKVFGYETAKKINAATVDFVDSQEAKNNRWKNQEREEIKALGIKPRSKESAAVQKYAEKEYINENGEYSKYGDRELAKEFTSVMKQNKIKKAAAVLRAKYDTYIDSINSVLVDMGYDPIPKRDNYMKHFYELTDKFSQWGVPFNKESMSEEDLPTDINGITDEFKPGKSWFASAMERTGMKTTYDAITGIDKYLEGAGNLIYHTESIQRYRTLSKFIREEFGKQHGMDNIENMSEEEIIQRMDDIKNNKLSKYAAWLDEQANSLAGKKARIDRAAERIFGRKGFTILNTIKQQIGSNMTGYNVRSAMTNFASAIQGASKTSKVSFLQGTLSTMQNIIHRDNLIDKSNFLTNRLNNSDLISKKAWQKAVNAGQIFMTGTDWFTSNQIWRSKYFENINKGMSENEAIKSADDFASRIMGNRSKGQTAEIFNSKSLGLITQFQLEVNNQWSSLIHDNKMDIQSGNKSGAMVVFQTGQLFALSHLFNMLMKTATGTYVMPDFVEMVKKIFGLDDEDKDKTIEQRAHEVMDNLVDNLPMANLLTRITGFGSGGRIPISEAFTGAKYIIPGVMLGTAKDEYGNPMSRMDSLEKVIDSAFYWILPTGYGQAKKAVKGMSMYSKKHPVAGSYTDSGNLRFEADTSGWGKTKAFLFGQYASKSAQDYINRDYSSVDKDKLKEMKKIGLSADEYTKLKTEIAQATKTQDDKKNYKYYDENGKLYYYNKDKDIVYDSKYKKTSIDIGELDKAKRKELLEKFLKSKKGLTSKQKEYLLENTFKGGKK